MKKININKKAVIGVITGVIIGVLLTNIMGFILKSDIFQKDEFYTDAKKYSQEVMKINENLETMYVKDVVTVYMDLSNSKIKGFYSFVTGKFKFSDGSVSTVVISYKNGKAIGFFLNEYDADVIASPVNQLGGKPSEFLECGLAYAFLEDKDMIEELDKDEVVKIYDDFSIEELS